MNRYREKLKSDGFVVIPPEAFVSTSAEELSAHWEQLPVDEYLQARCRFRRFGRCQLTDDSFDWLPPAAFLQSKQCNSVFGDQERIFAPLLHDFAESASLRHVTRGLYDLISPLLGGGAVVGVHQLSVVPGNAPTSVVPEGPHRDGFHYIAISLIRLDHVRDDAAVSSVIDPRTMRPVLSYRLSRALECLVIHDERLWHDCSPAIAAAGGSARRDVMVQTWSPLGFQAGVRESGGVNYGATPSFRAARGLNHVNQESDCID